MPSNRSDYTCRPLGHRRALLTRVLALVALAGAAAATAAAQDQIATVNTAPTEAESFNPGDIPGREKGERRPEPAALEPSEEPVQSEWFGGASWFEWTRMTGDWGSFRTQLENHGLTFDASYTLDWSSVWHGGLKNVASTRSVFSLDAAIDFNKMLTLEGASAYVNFLSSDMRGGSRDVGDYAGVSNIDTGDNVDEIAEVWFQQKLIDDKVRVKLGKIDANLEFAFPDFAEDVSNSGAAYSPNSNLVLPTYPNPSMGAVVFLYPTGQIYTGVGFFDNSNAVGVQTGSHGPNELWHGSEWLWIGEAGLTWKELGSLGRGRLALGGWYSTAQFERFDGGTDNGSTGFYADFSQQLTSRENWKDDEDPRGLFFFAQYGCGDDDVNDVANHLGAGLIVKGTCSQRDNDSAGVYLSWVDLSDQPESGYDENETALECFYKIQLTPWCFVKPDVQYIWNPGGVSDVENALVGGLRLQLSF